MPGAEVTNILGINNVGNVVGNYYTIAGTRSSGFLLSGGNFVLFDYPNADDTIAFRINDSGLISGWAVKGDALAIGFLYDGTTFTAIRAPGKSATFVRGINNAGVVVGGDGTFGRTKGFALVGRRFKDISPPGNYVFVIAQGVNNLQQIVGTADEGGFSYNRGTFKIITFPEAIKTLPLGISDNGIIVGWYEACTPSCAAHAFALKGEVSVVRLSRRDWNVCGWH